MIKSQDSLVVVGQGYVGLPLAMRAVEVGYNVIGLDHDKARVGALNNGLSFVEDIPNEIVRSALESGRYCVTVDDSAAADFGIAIITVPTPLRESLPDLTFIEAAARSLSTHLKAGAVVVLESTTYPGTTEELLVPILENGSNLQAGQDFYVGYSPERIDPGNPSWGLVNTPKVISGIDARSLVKVQELYSSLVEQTVPVSSPREAELSKLLENTFRHVNIALVNELAIFANQLGVDIWESIDAAATKPFGFMRFTPGPGVGGHCLPVDPSYLAWQVRRSLGRSFRFIELANDVNDHMPDYVVQRAMQLLNDEGRPMRDARVLLAGLAYKKNSGDVRESPALRMIELFNDLGAVVSGADPHLPDSRWPAGVTRVSFDSDTLQASDLVIIVTDHDVFEYSLLSRCSVPVLDTRNRTRSIATSRML